MPRRAAIFTFSSEALVWLGINQVADSTGLMLRSAAKLRVSKHEAAPSFETGALAPSSGWGGL